jgi:hypothetical protein
VSASTGPILAIGAVTMVNQSIINGKPVDWRVPIAAGAGAAAFSLMERGWPGVVVPLAWLALMVSIFVRVDPDIPPPIEAMERFWSGGDLAARSVGRARK